jgi:hypothetical protein
MARFTAPSLRAQTDDRFEWYVFVQAGTIPRIIKMIADLGATVIVADKDDVDSAQKLVRRDAGMIATLNLDTDDALAPDFVEEFHAHARHETGTIGFLRGMMVRQLAGWDPWAITWRSDTNPFQALIEDAGKARTIFSQTHKKIEHLIDLKRPMWLQVVHGENIDNWKLKKSSSDENASVFLHERFPTVIPKSNYGRSTNRR